MAAKKASYGGDTRKLVVAFDVGTTYSGVAYTVLDPGSVPQTYEVTRYAQSHCSDGNMSLTLSG